MQLCIKKILSYFLKFSQNLCGNPYENIEFLMESTESWEPGTVILKRSGPLIKQQRRSCASKRNTQRAPVPCGKSKQFVLISYDGSSHPISTPNFIPMDENITMRLFANDRNNIRCGNMQTEIDTYKYIYRGQASFNVQLLMESTESWEPGTVILKRSGPLIKQQRRSCNVSHEKKIANKSTMWKVKTVCFDKL
ncbi:BnaA01g34320D [Brassica napus]|uniref:BnaA01g34320D protein n=1 Tax=Brassica napus TaxID=3708 RepID=A0A078G705_BRANA|nr:BnaA01g34320D [Brassica napus]